MSSPLGPLRFLRFKRAVSRDFLESLPNPSLREVALTLNLENRWVVCDLAIPDNRKDLIVLILRLAHRPHALLHHALLRPGTQKSLKTPASRATPSMSKARGYWMARGGPRRSLNSTLIGRRHFATTNVGSVVHFCQLEFGTGVNISPRGVILTCSHVVTHSDDPDYDSNSYVSPCRLGRRKVVMWASGETSVVECVFAQEFANGKMDLALCVVVEYEEEEEKVIDVDDSHSDHIRCCNCRKWKRSKNESVSRSFPASRVWDPQIDPVPIRGDELVCVGCPSRVNLSTGQSSGGLLQDCDPPVWHTSIGKFLRLAAKPGMGLSDLAHSCWTYWGHSGAPLFHAKSQGAVVGIHSSWDNDNGERHAIDWKRIRGFVSEWEAGWEGKLPTCACHQQRSAGGEDLDRDIIVIDDD